MGRLEKITTEYMFDKLLPSFLNLDGVLYHFNMIKGKDGPLITYESENKSEITNIDRVKISSTYRSGVKISSTYRSGDDLRDVCEKTIYWLSNYVEYMPFGFKERYEEIFNSKDF